MRRTMIDASEIRALAFDLDGTLVDSAPDIGAALNEALRQQGLPRFDLQQVRSWIGDGPDALIDRALCAAAPAAKPAQHATLHRRLREAFDRATLRAPLAHGVVFDGIPELLDRLRPAWPLVVVTNKPSVLARAVLDAAGLLRHFAAVHGADRAEWRKPAPALLEHAAGGLGLQLPQLLMVGDSAADLNAAAAAGATAVFAGWGYGALHALPLPPRWRIERPGELVGLLGVLRGLRA